MAMQCVKTGCSFHHGFMDPNSVSNGDLFWNPVTKEIILTGCGGGYTLPEGYEPDVTAEYGNITLSKSCIDYIARHNPEIRDAYANKQIKLKLVTRDSYNFVSGWLEHC